MKLWKKAAAAVLAAVMSLTLLTGCSGGGGGGVGAAYVRDTEKEKLVTRWTQEYVADLYNSSDYLLTEDETAVSASEAAMSYLLQEADFRSKHPANMEDWTEAEKSEYSQLVSGEFNSAIKKLAEKNKKGVPVRLKTAVSDFSEGGIKNQLAQEKDRLMELLGEFDVQPQDVKTLGVVATIRDGVVYTEITFAT